jgi:DNA-3-methyladenine glycosylase
MELDENFFNRDAEIVARELLGKVLIREINGKSFRAKIVETEAYYDEKDPASRARQNGNLKKVMESEAGTILVYGVHNNWLINFIVNKKGKAEAVLLRALEPLNFKERCNGPGLLTRALKINKDFHEKNVITDLKLRIEENNIKEKIEIQESKRIGVKKDLKKPMRFYIKGNKFVSRK